MVDTLSSEDAPDRKGSHSLSNMNLSFFFKIALKFIRLPNLWGKPVRRSLFVPGRALWCRACERGVVTKHLQQSKAVAQRPFSCTVFKYQSLAYTLKPFQQANEQ